MHDLNKRIIVSITGDKIHKIMKSGLDILSKHPGVHLEARLDSANKEDVTFNNLKTLLMMFPHSHMVVTNYPKSEVGDKERFGFNGTEEQRWNILQYCAQEFSKLNNVNYLTAELDGFRKLERDPLRALVLVAKHFFVPYDSKQIEEALRAMKDAVKNREAEIAKVAALTKSTEEVADFRRLIKQYSAQMPLIAVPMGPYDFVKEARINSFYEDNVFATFAKSPKGKEAAPGQPSIEELIKYSRN